MIEVNEFIIGKSMFYDVVRLKKESAMYGKKSMPGYYDLSVTAWSTEGIKLTKQEIKELERAWKILQKIHDRNFPSR